MLEYILAVDEDSEGPYTIFAPTDGAFLALGEDILDYLDANNDILIPVLLYHGVPGAYVSSDLVTLNAPIVSPTFLANQTIEVIVAEDGIFVQGNANNKSDLPKVGPADLMTSNGVLHVLDKILMPYLPLGATAAVNGFSLLTKALDAANLTRVLNDLSDPAAMYTVFAPTDDAFLALGEEALNLLLQDTEMLTTVLLTHVVPSTFNSSDLAQGDEAALLETLSGQDIDTLEKEGSIYVQVVGSDASDVQVIATDIIATNGIVHVIDAVLLPE